MATRRPRWSKRRLEAAINAVTSMQAGPGPGEGDWSPDITSEDMEGARLVLIYLRDRKVK